MELFLKINKRASPFIREVRVAVKNAGNFFKVREGKTLKFTNVLHEININFQAHFS